MNATAKIEDATPLLAKIDPAAPVLKVEGLGRLQIKAGTFFNGGGFSADTEVKITSLEPGTDYVVRISGDGPVAVPYANRGDDPFIGGFHFAPGGNAEARKGGDTVPAINPYSLWDHNFRPACLDPRGMVLVEAPGHRFWCDIYLTGAEHLENGTSAFDALIADGRDCPTDPATGRRFKRFDYAAACAVMKHHGKQLLSFEEFAAAAFGVTERTATNSDPVRTNLDAPRTSKFGLMQAAGNMWVWGHDGDPDEPRASILGGSWWVEGDAGSRLAGLGDWADDSGESIGARGRSDHLQT
ncbi:hypothetical protein PMI42_04826 [Bradyrhizobium sp. YR681]|uniref:phage major tropism determinant n=1 Tax=Bradyrhizobium sp. YR681 TaxID=1144344 RepID=UPI0002710D20|nr:hypothetical protein [Bradyrhizobium sp. YR681]EJN11812.1 hypothetical protein PMI42_04826 [Bradyrhizobium sp. YR681]